jgi:gamma-glutamylcyclotransferase (GGCT)/AIG2-like uncharacterized protein YtfP
MRTFAYGMNMDAEGMPEGSTLIGPAVLRGWKLDFRGYADVQPAEPDDLVPGVVWEVTEEGLARLDMREGYRGPGEWNLYNRVEAEYDEPSLAGSGTAWVYTMQDAGPLRPPGAWYLEMIERSTSATTSRPSRWRTPSRASSRCAHDARPPTTRPVEEWIKHFSHFTDEQMLKEDYALSRMSGSVHCKLCDRKVSGDSSAHMAQHRREVAAYRKGKQAANAEAAAERLAAVRREKAIEKGLTPDEAEKVAVTGIDPVKRAYNRITSLRYKLNHPEKSGHMRWPDGEEKKILAAIEEATAAHKALAGKE